eukprot:1159792-Pelagomonas_calceolata.AAC.18
MTAASEATAPGGLERSTPSTTAASCKVRTAPWSPSACKLATTAVFTGGLFCSCNLQLGQRSRAHGHTPLRALPPGRPQHAG